MWDSTQVTAASWGQKCEQQLLCHMIVMPFVSKSTWGKLPSSLLSLSLSVTSISQALSSACPTIPMIIHTLEDQEWCSLNALRCSPSPKLGTSSLGADQHQIPPLKLSLATCTGFGLPEQTSTDQEFMIKSFWVSALSHAAQKAFDLENIWVPWIPSLSLE